MEYGGNSIFYYSGCSYSALKYMGNSETVNMKKSTDILLAFLVGCLLSVCQNSQRHNSPLFAKDTTIINERNNTLFVFIGEQLAFDTLPHKRGDFDAGFKARYRILERIYGVYPKDTIEFNAYDHYGTPPFSKHKTVMLYVSEEDGKYYHEKYQYHPLHKTRDGKWASPYDPADHAREDTEDYPLRPVKIDFAEEVSFSISGLKKQEIKMTFPYPYYKIAGDKAIALYGNYVPELFHLKKTGVLAARGLFGTPAVSNIPEVVMPDLSNVIWVGGAKVSKKDEKALLQTWTAFLSALQRADVAKIKEMSLDSVVCSVCEGFASPHFYNDMEPIDSFITASSRNLPGTALWQDMIAGKYKVSGTEYPKTESLEPEADESEMLMVYEVVFKTVTEFEDGKYLQYHRFQFGKTQDKFIFQGMQSG
jgi:hypothetical protein